MPTYLNGRIPLSLLVSIGSGVDAYGRYDWLLSPGTASKHAALLKRNPRLRPSPGYSCYRPFEWQTKYREIWGVGAAWPGTSSHGGFWEARQTLAIDYGNWAYCYGNRDGRDTLDKRQAFYADCRAVGLTPGMISKARGYPDEPWHVIDLDPWAPATASGGAQPFPKQEDVMNADQEAKFDAKFDVITARVLDLHRQLTGSDGHAPGAISRIIDIDQQTDGSSVKLDVIQARIIDLHQQVTGSDGRGPGAIASLKEILNAIAALSADIAPQASASIQQIADEVVVEIRERLAD